MSYAILRFAKLKSWGEIGGSLSHTYRTRLTLNADDDRAYLNAHSHEKTQDVKNDLAARIPEKRRSDAVLCLEHLITASPDWPGWGTDQEYEFFERSKKWLINRYGEKNVIAVSIHRDESTPHMIAYVVPYDEEKQKLNAKKWTGGRNELSTMQTSFAKEVKEFGLKRGIEGSKAEHVSIKEHYAKVAKGLEVEIQLEKLPKPKTLMLGNDKQKYAEEVLNAVLPDFENMQALAQEAKYLKKENQGLREKIQEADIYFDAVRDLNDKNKAYLDSFIQEESSKLLSSQQRIEAEKKAASHAENEAKEKRTNDLTNTFKDFVEFYNDSLEARNAEQKELNKRFKQSQKWLKKMGIDESQLHETDALGRSKYPTPDFFISDFEMTRQSEKSEKDFQHKIGSRAELDSISAVVHELRESTDSKRTLNALNDFDDVIQAVIVSDLKERGKEAEEYNQMQHENAIRERDRLEREERDRKHQELVNERMRKTREQERAWDNSPTAKPKDQNGPDFSM